MRTLSRGVAKALLFTCAALAPVAGTAAAAAEKELFELPRAAAAPAIDGNLDDAAWQAAPLAPVSWLSYNPLNGSTLPQTTEVRGAYDDKYLYFAFHCIDPEPAGVRGTLSRRDGLFNDDWVGLSLDSLGNGQSSYDLFVNPLGVQGDILNSASAGENNAPDFVWDSAGRRTAQGYDVEIRVPLTTVRFTSGEQVRMGILFWRRVSRLGVSVSWPAIPASASTFGSQALMTLRDVRRPLTLEVIPSATFGRSEQRTSALGFGRANNDPDAGLSVKYGITSAATIEGTLNPDFSQVESDAFQVDVNNRFPLFFAEKRPFFMEGLGTFEMAGVNGDAIMRTAVHTRRIVDPLWGTKTSGALGRVNFAVLAAGDEAPGRSFSDAQSPFPGNSKGFFIARGQYSFGSDSYLGGLVTDTEFGSAHNRVAAADVAVKRGGHKATATFYGTQTEAPEGARSDGLGGQVYHEYGNRTIFFYNQLEHFDRGFQMDTAFVNQVGITQAQGFLQLSLYPRSKKENPWLRRVSPFTFYRLGKDRIQGGNTWLNVSGVRFFMTRQGQLRLDYMFGREPWLFQIYPINSFRVFTEAQITRWLYFNNRFEFGRAIFYDPVSPFSGNQRRIISEVGFQPTARLNQTFNYERVEFERRATGERVFTVNVLNTRTTFQLDRRFSFRAIVNYDSSRSRVLTDLLASWELLPGTVAYAGYGSLIERQEWDGTVQTLGTGPWQTSRRGLFLKASYIHRF